MFPNAESQVITEGMKFNVFHDFFLNFVHEVYSTVANNYGRQGCSWRRKYWCRRFFVKIRIFIYTF